MRRNSLTNMGKVESARVPSALRPERDANIPDSETPQPISHTYVVDDFGEILGQTGIPEPAPTIASEKSVADIILGTENYLKHRMERKRNRVRKTFDPTAQTSTHSGDVKGDARNYYPIIHFLT